MQENKISNKHIIDQTLSSSFVLFSLWIIILYNFKHIFKNSWSNDPLAMQNTLYPVFFILLMLISILCFIPLIYSLSQGYKQPLKEWKHIIIAVGLKRSRGN